MNIWKSFLQQLDPFTAQIGGQHGQTGYVSTGLRQTVGEPLLYRASAGHDDRNRLGRTARGLRADGRRGHDHVNLVAHEFPG